MKDSINGVDSHICFSNVSKSTMISIIWKTELWFTNYRVRRTRSAIFGRCTIFLITQIRFDSFLSNKIMLLKVHLRPAMHMHIYGR